MKNPSIASGGSFGPLFPYFNTYAAHLKEQGYAVCTKCRQINAFKRLSRWLGRTNRRVRELNESVTSNFLRSAEGRFRKEDSRAMVPRLLPMLRRIGAIPAARVQLSPAEKLTQNYQRFLSEERGLASSSIENYGRFANRFLATKFGSGRLKLSKVSSSDVTLFVKRHAHQHSPWQARSLVKAMRSFLRYLYYKHLVETDWSPTVPKVAFWSFSTLPKFLSPEQVRQLLSHCDRTKPLGRRDYAILLLLARLGLRAGEVARLNLEDIDWENSRITVFGKSQIRTQLPLPADAGKAIASYLRHDRPRCACRRLFICAYAPIRGFTIGSSVSDLVKRALAKAEIVVPGKKGAHLLRHGLATAMLRKGASLDEIGEVLRHKSRETTAIYAKVDLESLRALALPWPGGAQ